MNRSMKRVFGVRKYLGELTASESRAHG